MKDLSIVIIFLCVLIIFTACSSDGHFDSEKWKYKYDMAYPYRPDMIQSIINSELLTNKKFYEVLDLLGEPNNTDTIDNCKISCIYEVQESYGWNIDPLYRSWLVIEFNLKTNETESVEFMQTEDKRSILEKIFTE
ncbi:MAG: hypothetical protein LBQ22_12955 [Bacteroidales bacterium]|jgi:hypothetical protein|nr:hypothetical protein [Bacteroidales bacterium]